MERFVTTSGVPRVIRQSSISLRRLARRKYVRPGVYMWRDIRNEQLSRPLKIFVPAEIGENNRIEQ